MPDLCTLDESGIFRWLDRERRVNLRFGCTANNGCLQLLESRTRYTLRNAVRGTQATRNRRNCCCSRLLSLTTDQARMFRLG